MISIQAIIHTISPFDANIGPAIHYTWNGNQPFKNRCIIKDNDTQEIVYDVTITTFKNEHIIDPSQGSLKNGNRYVLYLTVFDSDDEESEMQQIGTTFLCLKTPIFRFTNLIENQNIASSIYTFQIDYSQENGELLNSWSVVIYSKTKAELDSSGIMYDTEDLSYTCAGFSDKNEYYVRATGITVNGYTVDTGYIPISVSYITSSIFYKLNLENVYKNGTVHVKSNIVSAEGKTDKPPVYIDDEAIDLRDNRLFYDQGFLFDGDFSLVTYFYGMSPNQTIIEFLGKNKNALNAKVTYRITIKNGEYKSYFELRIISGNTTTVLYSNQVNLLSQYDKVGLCIVRNNGLYNIQIHKFTE